ncbi:MAG TPA: hypothetical protein VM532_07955, partial [Burkholderiales bacterium]|nr:hypothetical protein [Burkholderiales bacterium]
MNSGEQSEAQRGALATSMATTPAYLMNSRENAYEVLKKDYISTLLSGDEIRKSVADSNLKDAVLHFENFEHYRDPQSGHYWDPLLGTYHPNFEVNVLQVVDDLKRSAIRDHINVVANDPAIEPSAKLATWAKLLPLLERFDRAPQLFLRDVVREACMNIKAGLDIHSEFYSSQDVTTLSSLAKISGVSLGIVDNVDRNNVFNSVYKIAHRIITSQNVLNIGEEEFNHAGYLIAQACTGDALAKIAVNGLRPLLKLAAEFDRYPADHIYDSASKRVMHQLIVKTRIDQLQDDADISAFAKYYVDHFDSFHSDGSPIWILPPSMRTQRCLEIASKLISSSTTDKNAERAVALSATSFLGNVRFAGANAINLSQAAALAEIYSQRLQDPDCRAALQEIGDRLLRHPLEPVTGATVDIVLSLGRSFHQLPIDVAFRQPVLNYIASQTLSLDLSNLDEERASLANTHYSSIIEPYINAPNISVADKENAQSNYGATMGEEIAPSVSMQTSPHEIVFGGQQLSPPEPSSPLPSEPSLPLETDSSIDARPRLNEIVFGNLQLSPSEQESLLRWNPSVRMPSMPSRIDATYSPQEPFEPIFSPAAPSSVNSPAEQSELGVEEPPQNISESEPPLVTTPKISMPMPPSPRGFVTLDPYDRDFPSLPPPTVDAPNRSTALVAAQPPQRIFRPTPLPRTTPPVKDVNPLQLSEVGRPDQYPSISMPQTPSGIASTDSPQRPFDSEQSEFGAEDSQQRHYESAFPSLGTSSPSTPAKSSGSINDNLRQRRFRPTPRQGSMQKPTELVQTLSKPSIVGAPESSESATTTSDTPAMPHRKAVAPPEASHPPILGRMRKQPKQVERKPQKEKQPTQKREELEPAKPVAVEEAPTTNKVEQRLAVEPWRDFETRPIPETALESAIVASAKSCFDADKFLQDFQNFGEAEGAAALAFGVRALDRKLLIGNDAAADLLGDSSASSLIVDQKSIHDRFIQADRVLRTQPKSVAQLNQFMVFIKENGIQAPGVEFSRVMKEGVLETGIDDQAAIAWAYEASKYFAAYPDETLPDNAVTAANAILANPDKLGRLKRNQIIRETLDKFDANVSRAITSEANLDVDKLIDVLDQYRQGDRDKRFELSQKIHQITEGTNKEEIIEKILSDSRRNSEAPTNTPPSVEAISDYFSQVLRQPLSASHPDGYLSAIQIYANDPEIAANFSDLEWWSTFVDGPSNDRRAIFLLR